MTSKVSHKIVSKVRHLNDILCTIFSDKYRSIKNAFTVFRLVNKCDVIVFTHLVIYTP